MTIVCCSSCRLPTLFSLISLISDLNLAALRKVAEKVSIPVATGERLHTRYDYRMLFELQAADIIQPDITHFRSESRCAEEGGGKGVDPCCYRRTAAYPL